MIMTTTKLKVAICDNCGFFNSVNRLEIGCWNCRRRIGNVYQLDAEQIGVIANESQ